MASLDKNEVEKILGEPIFIEFSDYIRKIRTNLLIVSFLSLGIQFFGIEIDPHSTLFGLKFKGFNNDVMIQGLLIINIYVFIHFAACSIDSFKEWMVRITGTKVAHVTAGKMVSEEGDYPSDPRQSTLYNWWKGQAGRIGNFKENLDSIEERLDEIATEIQNNGEGNISQQNLNNVTHPISNIKNTLHDLQNRIKVTNETFESTRIPVSLERFDQCYKSLLKTQNLRWLVIEFLFPLLVGSMAIVMLANKIIQF
ncbi:MAG: hypothetical protein IH886_14100 [Nitrospinae bacterium]|nr:hypothetical protein [Nitrospinota bacterium]